LVKINIPKAPADFEWIYMNGKEMEYQGRKFKTVLRKMYLSGTRSYKLKNNIQNTMTQRILE
jgi:hypothetical protein